MEVPIISVLPAPPQEEPPTRTSTGDPLRANQETDGSDSQDDLWASVRKPCRLNSGTGNGNRSLIPGGTSQFAIAAKTAEQTLALQAKMSIPQNSIRGRTMAFVHGRAFTVTVASAIAINVIFLGIETDHADLDDNQLGLWYYLEVGFTIGFCIELALRLFADRSMFFNDRWNIFDLLLVVSSCIDNFIVEHIAHGSAQGKAVEVISVMRILRIARVARIIRLLRFFKKLWLLICGVVDAMRTLVWALILIAIVIFVFGMLMTRALGDEHAAADENLAERFGSVPKSMFTLFQVMTLEGWPDIVRGCMAVQPWIWPVFLIFLMLTTFSIMNVIVAVIVESTLEQANDHHMASVKHHESELKEASTKIAKIFNTSDADGDGQITQEEFHNALQRKDVLAYLEDVGIDVRQAENLFEILDYDDSGTLDAKEFTSGCLKARGGALAKDILAVQCELWRYETQVRREVQQLCRDIDQRMAHVNADIDVIHSDLEDLRCSLGISRPEVNQYATASEFLTPMSNGLPAMADESQVEEIDLATYQGADESGMDSALSKSLPEPLEEDCDRAVERTGSMKRVRAPLLSQKSALMATWS